MVLATYITSLQVKRADENAALVWDGVLIVIGLGLVGARLYHVFSSPNDGSGSGWDYYRQNPLQIFAIWKGGLGIYGGLVGGFIGLLYVVIRNRLNLMRWMDFVAPGVLLAQAIGRWGNYANQELYGGPTGSSWWGITIDQPFRTRTAKIDFTDMQQFPPDTRFHPTFFYESAWNFIGFVIIMILSRRLNKRLHDGDLIAMYFIWYGIGRGWVEFLFRPDAWTIGVLPTAVWVSFGSIAIGLAIMAVTRIMPTRRPAMA
jgi:phosphatidylglycerol:prolipoprotein diacylglycerol transferase